MNNSENTKDKNKRIAPILRAMIMDAVVEIPEVQYPSVMTTIFRIQTQTTLRFSTSKNKLTKMVEVTRTANSENPCQIIKI